MDRWKQTIRDLHDEAWEYDWETHLAQLNARLGLTGPDVFGLPPGLPPSWVVGDLDPPHPGDWVLVISLNQARREEDEGWHLDQGYTSQSYWDHWRYLNRNWWEPRFYRPLVRLAATALGLQVDRETEAEFATTRTIFVELCPYPSRRFALDGPTVKELMAEDAGFRTASTIRRLLIEEGAPVVIMLNGVTVVREFGNFLDAPVSLAERRYPSPTRAGTLRHWEGVYPSPHRPVPMVGFPFLRKPSTHNSYAEIEFLGQRIRRFRAHLADTTP